MKRKSEQKIKATKVRNVIRKSFVVLMLTVTCATVRMEGTTPNSYQSVYAANTASLSSVVPTFEIQSRSGKNATLIINSISNAAYYRIYRSTSVNGTYSYVGTTSSKKFTDSGLKASKAYYYKITANNGNITSKYSKSLKLSATLGKVTNLKGSYSTIGTALNWSGVTGAAKYKVYRSVSKDSGYQYIGSSTTTSYIDRTAQAGQTYYYRVRAMKTVSDVKYNGVYSTKLFIKCNVSSGNDNNGGSGNNTGDNSGNSNSSNESYVAEVLRLVNIERKKEGLSELGTGTKLNQAAHQRAIEIKSVFSHSRPDGSSCFTALGDYGVSYRTAGENIAYGQKTPAEVVTGWMNSEGHRKNILNGSFGNIGIGCYYSNGTYYWTQLFTN